MKIAKIKGVNFKGHNFLHDLAGVNIVTGPNASGKTAILQAVRLVLTGSLPPPIGKLPSSIYQLAGNPESHGEMSVKVRMTNNRDVLLQYVKDTKGSVKAIGTVPADLALPPLLCEPRQFFAMTGAERIKTVFGACDLSQTGFGPDLLKKAVAHVQESPARIAETVLDEVCKGIDDEFKANGDNPQLAAGALINRITIAQKMAKTAKETASGAFQAFRTKVDAVRPVDKTAEIKALEAKIAGSSVNQGVQRGQLLLVLSRLENQFEDLLGGRGDFIEQSTNRVKSNNLKVVELRKHLAAENQKEPVNVKALEETLDVEVAARNKAIDAREAKRIAHVTKQTMLTTIVALKVCAKCSKKLVKPLEQEISELSAAIGQLNGQIQQFSIQSDQTQAGIEAGNTANQARAGRIEKLESEITAINDQSAKLSNLIASYNDTQEELKNWPETAVNNDDADKMTELREQQKAYDQHRRDITRRDELEEEVLKEQCREAVFKASAKIIIGEQEKIMAFAFNELLKVAHSFTDGILNSPLEFSNGELGRRVVEADVKAGIIAPVGAWIGHETMSGTEQMLCYAGLSIALCQKAPIKLIFCDELAIVRRDLRLKVIQRMAGLVNSGVIDQAILADPEGDYSFDSDIIKIIKL